VDKQSKKIFIRSFDGAGVIFIAAIVAAFGGVMAAWEARKFESEVKAKNEEIVRLNNYILSSITGGDSFCYLALANINNVSNRALLTAISKGRYPLYDVHFRIVDLEELYKIKDNMTFENLKKTERTFNVGNIHPNVARMLGTIELGAKNEKEYNVFISARNGVFTQLIRLKHINEEWKTATKVLKREGDNNIVLLEKIDEKFSSNENGEVDWK